ncbi:hypothetical protein [Salinibius halmophilus]|uniref:hypothetical protein n=1 Tax=Salinibius halmophilus TaxID=1853216 RepID=UPI000E66CC20|nr:hypothetical protein [Salinibius halmophilus]
MNDATSKPVFTPPQSDLFHQNEADLLREQMAAMQATIATLTSENLWLKRELFGVKGTSKNLRKNRLKYTPSKIDLVTGYHATI